MSRFRYALVSWTKGPDKDAVSIVPTKWIIDFDPEDTSRTFLVECRTANTKKPVNGWPVEHAVVLQLAEKESTLKVAERTLLKVDTPKDEKRIRKPKRLFCDEDSTVTGDETNPDIPRKKTSKLAARKHAEEEILFGDSQSPPGSHSPDDSPSDDNAAKVRDLENQVKVLQKENSRLRNLAIKEIPALLADVRKVLSNDTSREAEMLESPSENEAVPLKAAEVKLGSDGITISTHCWETAKSQKSPNGMARVLLMGLFGVDILIKSNLTGGMNKVDPAAERRQALDRKRLQALVDAVVNHHPGVRISDIRKAINARICELRHQVKRKNATDVTEQN